MHFIFLWTVAGPLNFVDLCSQSSYTLPKKRETMKQPLHYVTDPWHFLDDTRNLPDDLPNPARRLILFLGQIIEEMSALPAGTTFVTSLKCRRRPGRKPCPGEILSWRNNQNDSIKWMCTQCGTGGEVHNWRGCPWDKSGGELGFVS